MELTVRGEVFKITLVNNYVHEKYIELVGYLGGLQATQDDIEKEASATTDIHNLRKKYREIAKDSEKIKKNIVGLRREMIREIVETNGYEYNEKFWTRQTDPDDINDFLYSCVSKDTGKKKQ